MTANTREGQTMMTRADHCTHPDQAWCDCDWCRVIRTPQQDDEGRCLMTGAARLRDDDGQEG